MLLMVPTALPVPCVDVIVAIICYISFRKKGQIFRGYYGVAAVQPAASRCPLGICIRLFESHPQNKNKGYPNGYPLFLWGG
jgi:hypothetical protein